MLVLALGVMATIITARTSDRDTKIASCLELAQARVQEEDARIQAAVDSSSFRREQVISKIMISMMSQCVNTISLTRAKELVFSDDNPDLISSSLSLVPFPEREYKTDKDIELNLDERRLLSDVQELISQSEELNEKSAVPLVSEAISPVVGVTCVLLVFGVLTALGIYGVKRSRKIEGKKKKSR